MKKSVLITSIIMILVISLSLTYSFFSYRKTLSDVTLNSGEIAINFNDENNTFTSMSNYPKKDVFGKIDPNYYDFSVSGTVNDEVIYYEIQIKELSGNTLDPRYIKVYLTDQEDNSVIEPILLSDLNLNDYNNNRIVYQNHLRTSNQVDNYRLRLWIDESYTENTAKTFQFKVNLYARNGEVSLENAYMVSFNYRNKGVENNKTYLEFDLSNKYLLKDAGQLLEEEDNITLEITNPSGLLYLGYRDSEGNEEEVNNESLTLNYTYNRNKAITIRLYAISKSNANVTTGIKFKVTKNSEVIQEYTKQVSIYGNNYCLNNGFTKLADCILVSDNLSANRNAAIASINAKGTPDVNHTAPTYEYVELMTENQEYTGTAGYPNWSSGASYVFNSSTGTFALKKADGTTNASSYIALSDNLIGTYTCGTSNSGYGTCGTIYKVTSVDTANNKITGTKITYKMNSSMDSQVGLYKVRDDNGDSYIFRGNVTNNNVYFGGYYWKIIRINGDGSIRLIFNGNALAADGNKTAGNNATISSTRATGINATYPFNSNPGGPTYVGYMNTESTNYWTTSTLGTYSNFSENTVYYFADDFETYTDTYGNRMFKLKGNTYQSKVKDLTTAQIKAKPYTCSGTSANLICSRLIKVDSRTNVTTVKGYYITYSPNYEANTSLTKADVEKNENDSTAKKQLDAWYETKFMNNQNNGKVVTTYLVDSPFCNDRTISASYTNGSYTLALSTSYQSGYLLTNHSYYQARRRLIDAADTNKSATLLCNKNDNFSVTETSNTNGKLTYPIGLITADEVALAGGKYNEKNENYWLRTNGYFWTMTPSYFPSTSANAYEFSVNTTGLLSSTGVASGLGLRAVINLSSNTLISTGDGTASNPYVID